MYVPPLYWSEYAYKLPNLTLTCTDLVLFLRAVTPSQRSAVSQRWVFNEQWLFSEVCYTHLTQKWLKTFSMF